MENLKDWEKRNSIILNEMDKWRDSYTCKCNCKEWQKWGYCPHLRNALANKFSKEIEIQISSLINLNPIIAVEPSLSLAVS